MAYEINLPFYWQIEMSHLSHFPSEQRTHAFSYQTVHTQCSQLFLKHKYLLTALKIVSTTNRYGLDGPGIKSQWGQDISHPSRPALGPTQPPVEWVPRPFPATKRS
jgi:hypothetical protein